MIEKKLCIKNDWKKQVERQNLKNIDYKKQIKKNNNENKPHRDMHINKLTKLSSN